MTDNSPNSDRQLPARTGLGEAKVYLVGGGIASMAAAAFMIRDGDVLGRNRQCHRPCRRSRAIARHYWRPQPSAEACPAGEDHLVVR